MSNFLVVTVESEGKHFTVGRLPLTDDLAEFGFGGDPADMTATNAFWDKLVAWFKTPRLTTFLTRLQPISAVRLTIEFGEENGVPQLVDTRHEFGYNGDFDFVQTVMNGLKAVVSCYANSRSAK